MRKKIIYTYMICAVFFGILNVNAQTSYSASDILAMSPNQRESALTIAENWEWSDLYDAWLYQSGTVNGRKDYFVKYYKNQDLDNYGVLNDYVFFLYTSYTDASSDYIESGRTCATVIDIIYDMYGNSLGVNKEVCSYNYNGFNWIRGWGYDCDDADGNSPAGLELWYKDSDGDGHGDASRIHVKSIGCSFVSNVVPNNTDCNDLDNTVQDAPLTYYADNDGDGYGNINMTIQACGLPGGYVTNSDDCNDTDALVNLTPITWYADTDDDGFGDPNDTIQDCFQPTGYVSKGIFDECPSEKGNLENGCAQFTINFDDSNQNYQYTRNYLNEFNVSQSKVLSNDNDVIQSITYFNGLGNAKQQNNIKSSSNGLDIIQHFEYDGNGEANKVFMPYVSASNTGLINYNSASEVANFYLQAQYDNTQNPHTEARKENSPLKRVLEQAAVGNDWEMSERTIKFEYKYNQENSVLHFNIDDSQVVDLMYNGFYTANSLMKSITKNENWEVTDGLVNTYEEFNDHKGNLILKRHYVESSSGVDVLDTYYIHDANGKLRYVLSPEASEKILDGSNAIVEEVLDNLGYQYKYDYRNRLIEKKIPGKGWEFIVYDKLDRPVMTQDANLAAQNKWLFTKYDAFGRVLFTGVYLSSQDRSVMQSVLNNATVFNESRVTTPITLAGLELYYSNVVFPETAYEILTVNYYDDYDFGSVLVSGSSNSIEHVTQVAQVDQTFTSTAGYGWNSGFNGSQIISGDGYIEYTVGPYNKRMMIGLGSASGNLTNYHYEHIEHAAYTGYAGDYRLRMYYAGGWAQQAPLVYFEEGDVIRIERKGTLIHFKKNGETFYQSPESSTGDLVGRVSFLDPEASISNFSIVNTVYDAPVSNQVKGLATGSVVKVLETDKYIRTVSHYDDKGRVIYVASNNEYLETSDIVTSKYDFVGNVLEMQASHVKSGAVTMGSATSVVTVDRFTYDHQNRLLSQSQSINGGRPTVLVSNRYDELGQLVEKQTGVQANVVTTEVENMQYVIREGNTFTKVISTGFNGNFETVHQFEGDGYIEYTVTATEKRSIIGLSDPTEPLDNSYHKINYAIYTGHGSANMVYIFEESELKSPGVVTYEAGDTFTVAREGTDIVYKKNGIPFYTTNDAIPGALIGDGSLRALGTYIKDVKLVDVNLNAGQALQTIDYAYNVRGWLKQINNPNESLTNDVFAFGINYNQTETGLGASALYNGNISETIWKTASDDQQKAYAYQYDALNRITSGVYGAGPSHAIEQNFYNLNGINYDKNGNILALNRNGGDSTHSTAVTIDDLTYGYAANSNQLQRVSDASLNTEGFNDTYVNNSSDPVDNDYGYDANGNMITDKNKHITSIEYNYLNLPTRVVFDNQTGGTNDNVIEYVYDAAGVKQAKIVTSYSGYNDNYINTTQYAGNFVYKGTKTLGSMSLSTVSLEFFNHPEGYTEPYKAGKATLYRYIYQMKDHLGNIRVSYCDYDKDGVVDLSRKATDGTEVLLDIDGDGDFENEIVQTKNYYPFGLQHNYGNNSPMSVVNGRDHKFGFGGKEEQNELGLGWIDITARNYDAALGRWMNLDPLAEQMRRHSPYNFAFDNPIYFIDPDGEAPEDFQEEERPEDDYGIDASGLLYLIRKTNDKFDRLFSIDGTWSIFDDISEIESGDGFVKFNKNSEGNSILSELYKSSEPYKYYNGDVLMESTSYITNIDSKYKNEIFSLFKFVADNSNKEWSLHKFEKEDGSVDYQFGTYLVGNFSPGFNGGGKWKGAIHSHPDENTHEARMESLFGDGDRGSGYLIKYEKHLPYLIYFPSTGKASSILLPKDELFYDSHVRHRHNITNWKF